MNVSLPVLFVRMARAWLAGLLMAAVPPSSRLAPHVGRAAYRLLRPALTDAEDRRLRGYLGLLGRDPRHDRNGGRAR